MLKVNIKEKSYGRQVILSDICIDIESPGIYGVIGKNGEGKTTLFKCILGLEQFDGYSQWHGSDVNLQVAAWCGTEPTVYDELTVGEFYEFYKHLIGVEREEISMLFTLPEDKLIKTLSTGMKRKVFLNAVLQKDYALYVLDEPFNGLDIESNHMLIRYLMNVSKNSVVLVSSHIIDVLYKYCESIYMVRNKGVKLFDRCDFEKIEDEFFD